MKNTVRKWKIVLPVMLGAALLLGGCGSSTSDSTADTAESAASSETESSGELTTVRIGCTSATAQLTDAALLAQNLGYLDEELEAAGYAAEYVGFAGAGPAINEAFAADEIDYAIYAEFPAMTATSNSVDITVIGTVNSENNYALLVTDESGITSGADMEGKKIIVTSGTILYKYFADLCDEYGIDPNDVDQVAALSDAQSVLQSGEADGLIITLAAATYYEEIGLGTVVEDTTEQLELASGMVIAGSSEFVDANAEANKAILRAIKRAAEFAEENPDEVYAYLLTDSSTETSLEAAYGYDTSFSYFSPEITDAYLERAQSVLDFASDNGLLGSEEVSLDELFDSTYVDEVMAED